MYQSSVAFGNLIQQDSRTFRAQITLGDNSITEGIRSIKINGGSNSEDDFSLGSAVSQYVEIDIAAPDIQFEGHEFLLELGIVVNDSVEEYVPMGYFTAEKPEGDEEQVSIVAYDRMVKTERPCFLSLSDQTNTIDVLKAVGAITGVPVVTEGLASISMQKPVGYTCREVLSYVAQLYGGFAVCNRQGQIEIKTYEDHGYTVGTGRYWDTFTHNDLAYSLEKITCYTGKDESGENISITVGEGMRGISISNPFMTQAALNDVWASLNNYTYMPGNFRFLGDPRIDPWDILTVEDRNGKSYKVPAMKLTQDYDGGLSTEVEAVGKSEAEQESGFQGPMTQQMERYYAQLVLIDHAMVNKLDAETARITYATIENLEAVNAAIATLDVTKLTARVATIEEAYIGKAEVNTLLADYASVAQLNAVNAQVTNISGELSTYKTQVAGQFTAFDADITSLKAKDAELETALIGTAKVTDLEAIRTRTQQLETDVAGINTLVNGNLTSDNIQSMVITGDKFTMENGFIKSAMIDSLAADKITGLDINTTKLTVHSNDGKSTWTDNTIQIADADRVRVQIGEDASGDYNIYIWDSSGNLMWNATGATSAGLNDGIIKDVAVAADANISGSKLDIESVIREVNGATTTIKGTRIKLDEQNQTLDAAFTSLKTYAEGVNSKTESNTTAISVAQGQISTLISNTTIVKDGQTVQLKDAFNSTVADVNSIKTTINEHTSLIDQQSGEILAVTAKANTIESDLNGTKQTVSAVQSDLSGTKSRVSTVESGLDGLKSRVTATETSLSKKADGTTVDSLTSRVATAESTINGFQVSLTATNKTVSDNYTALNSKIDGIEIGGRNLLPKSKMGKTTAISSNSLSGYGYTKGLVNTDIAGRTAVLRLKSSTNYVISFTAWCGANTQQMNVDLYPDTLPEKVFTLTTTPTRYAFSVYSNNADMPNGCLRFFRANGFTENVYITDILVEQGTKASQTWTPAPEDTDSILNAHTEQLSTHDTRITANENAISLKVSTSDYNAYKTTVNNELTSAKSRLSTAESSITALNGQIALKVEQTDIDDAVDNLEIGGRNLIINSSFEYEKNGWNGIGSYTSVVQEGRDGKFCSKQIGALQTTRSIHQSRCLGVKPNENYTFSGWYKTDSLTLGTTSPYVKPYVSYTQGQNTWVADGPICDIPTGTNDWTYVETTFTVPNRSKIDSMMFYLFARDFTGTIWWDDVKLERGNKATDWTPAPEDTDTAIDDVKQLITQTKSEIKITTDSITQSVTSIQSTVSNHTTQINNKADTSTVNALTSRVSAAEQKLTKDSLVTTIGSYYATQTALNATNNNVTAAQNAANNAYSLADAKGIDYSQGKMLQTDPMFASGTNSCGVYNNSPNGTVTVTRTAKSSDNPMTGTSYELTVKTAGTASPGLGGYVQSVNSRANAVFIRRIIAKIPTGYKIRNAQNAMGTGYTVTWLTPRDGTGKFTEYVYKYVCGPSGTFSNGGHVYLEGTAATSSSPVTWYVAYSTTFDMTNVADVIVAQTVATQTQEMMRWVVKSGTSATDFTLTDRTATLIANSINLNGLVTFSGLDSAAQTKINTAQSTADSAKTAAANAQSTANTAKTNAATAQSTANAAQSAANAAQSTANTALSYIDIKDTRSDNQNPQWYITNYPRKIVREFKSCSAIGLSVSSTYCTLETKVPWSDSSGGYPTQVATVGNDNKVYKRIGTSGTTWSAWVSTDQVIADWCYNNNLTYINGGKIYAKTVTTTQLATDAIKSLNYAYSSGNFSTAGTFLDLSNGVIRSKNFAIDSNGNAYFKGTGNFSGEVTATSGAIGGWTIGSGTLIGSGAGGRIDLSSSGEIHLYRKSGDYYYANGSILPDIITIPEVSTDSIYVSGASQSEMKNISLSGTTKVLGLAWNSSGGHLVFASDGATLAYAPPSSRRYKDIKQELTDKDVEKLYDIPVMWAKYKDGLLSEDDERYGKYMPMFIAEDVDAALSVAADHQNGIVEDWNFRVMVPAMFQMIKGQKRRLDELDAGVLSARTSLLEAQSRISGLDAKLQSETASLRSQVSSLQYQLQQAFARIAEQDKLIKQLQAAG